MVPPEREEVDLRKSSDCIEPEDCRKGTGPLPDEAMVENVLVEGERREV